MKKAINIKNIILILIISMFSVGMFSLSKQISPQEITPYQYEDSTASEGSESIEQQSSKSMNKVAPTQLSTPVAEVIAYPTPGNSDGIVKFSASWNHPDPSAIKKVDFHIPGHSGGTAGYDWWGSNLGTPPDNTATITITNLANKKYNNIGYDVHIIGINDDKRSSPKMIFWEFDPSSPPYDLQDPIVSTVTKPYVSQDNGTIEIKGSWKFDHADPIEKVDVTVGGQNGPWTQNVVLDSGNKSFTVLINNLSAKTYNIRYDIHITKIDGSPGSAQSDGQVNSIEVPFTLNDKPLYDPPYNLLVPAISTITKPDPGVSNGVIEVGGIWDYDYSDPIEHVELFVGGTKHTLMLGDLTADHKSFTYQISNLLAGFYYIHYDVHYKPKVGTTTLSISSSVLNFTLEPSLNYYPPSNLTDPAITTTAIPNTDADDATIEVSGSWQYPKDDPMEGVDVYVNNTLQTSGSLVWGFENKSFIYTVSNVSVGTHLIRYDVIYKDLDNTSGLSKSSKNKSHTITSTNDFSPAHTLTKPVATTTTEPNPGISEGVIEISGNWQYDETDPIEHVELFVGANSYILLADANLLNNNKSFTYTETNLLAGTYDIYYDVHFKNAADSGSLSERSAINNYTVEPLYDFSPAHMLTKPIVTTTILPSFPNTSDGEIKIEGSWQYDDDDPIEHVELFIGANSYTLLADVDLLNNNKSFVHTEQNITIGTYDIHYVVYYKDVNTLNILNTTSVTTNHLVEPLNDLTPPDNLTKPVATTIKEPLPTVPEGEVVVEGSWEYDNDDPIKYVELFVDGLMHKKLELTDLSTDNKSFAYTVTGLLAGEYDIHYEVYYKDINDLNTLSIISPTTSHEVVEKNETIYATIIDLVTEDYVFEFRDGSISFDYEVTNPYNIANIEKIEINLTDIKNSLNNKTIALDLDGSDWQGSIKFDVGLGEYEIDITSTFTTSQGNEKKDVILAMKTGLIVEEEIFAPLTAEKFPDITMDTFSISVRIIDDWGVVKKGHTKVTVKINEKIVNFETGLWLEYDFSMPYNEEDIESYEVIISLMIKNNQGETLEWTGDENWEEFTWYNGIQYNSKNIFFPLIIIILIFFLGAVLLLLYHRYRKESNE